MKIRFFIFLLLIFLIQCSGGAFYGSGEASSDSFSGEASASSPEAAEENQTAKPEILLGHLTAGDWDDNRNFEAFAGFLQTGESLSSLPLADRIIIQVLDKTNQPFANAQVKVYSGETVYLRAPTARDGRLLFFPQLDGVSNLESVSVMITPNPGHSSQSTVVTKSLTEKEWIITLPEATATVTSGLDLAFVIDATGSMCDEINYIKAEIANIVDQIKTANASLSIQFALIVYRDQGDEFVTRVFDFTSDLNQFSADLAVQKCDGGGDYPESAHEAMKQINRLSWRSTNIARIAFHIADAPPHSGEQSEAFLTEANKARKAGIKIFPVAASGVAIEAEYLMRQAALITQSRYIFLTDDSGIGATHEKPHIPCYLVQYLNKLIVNTILSELSGAYVIPKPEEILKAVGNPQNGKCPTETEGQFYYLY